ncbi:hypothetical protein B0T14DRAFT_439291 [Immersiella caudata]|uniref:SET domain-containing protein n=1 Tax=Immersiella caudata TaxID=314043 RepID=A0AA39WAM6_9PEZI|nr:hypothetical protein B0T14DRAFT_439291 [Immersiella caudata]
MPLFPPAAFLVSNLLLSAAAAAAAATPQPICGWGLPRNSLNHTPLCPAPFLSSSSSSPSTWSPWTHPPHCISPGPWCVYTNAALPFLPVSDNNNTGLSIITTPELASTLFDLPSHPLHKALSALPADNLTHRLPTPYEVRPVPGKGLGVFATRRIPRGKVILIDYLALLATVAYPGEVGRDKVRELMQVGVERLGAPERVRGLAGSKGGKLVVEEDVLVTNAFELPLGMEEVGYMGLFVELSRINHACNPNAHVHFSETTLAMTIWSAKDIEVGEEITISYSSTELTSEERKETLLKQWGFKCTCSLCSAPQDVLAASDARRREFRAARDGILQLAQEEDFHSAVEVVQKLFKLVEEEELEPHLGDLYEIPARLYYQVGDLENARKYFKRSMWEYYGWGVPGPKDQVSLQNAAQILARLEEDIALRREEQKNKKKRKPQVYLGKIN